jgi:alkylation response protein AidB-like acyl-CoA dehydrogenase
MEFSISTEHKLLQSSVREFLKKECPIEEVRKLDENEEFPLKVFTKMKELGLSSLTVSEKYGGTGRDLLAAVMVLEELSKHFPCLGCLYAMSAFYGGLTIEENGTENQRQQFLPSIAQGGLLFSYGSGESSADLDIVHGDPATASSDGAVRVYGTKRQLISADRADYIIILESTAKKYRQDDEDTMYLVRRNAKGIEISMREKLGLRGVAACDVKFSGVEVQSENIVRRSCRVRECMSQALRLSEIDHLQVATACVGVAQGAFGETLKYSRKREQFGQSISRFQAIEHMLVEMATWIQAARLLVQYSAWIAQQNKPCSVELAMAKYYAADAAKHVCVHAMQVFGGYGYMMECDIQRYFRDALALSACRGTSHSVRSMIAENLYVK